MKDNHRKPQTHAARERPTDSNAFAELLWNCRLQLDCLLGTRCDHGPRLVSTTPKAVFVLEPIEITIVMITAAIAATMIPYSTAVAPSSSDQKFFRFVSIFFPQLRESVEKLSSNTRNDHGPRLVSTTPKAVFVLEPIEITIVMITAAIAATMIPYSTAVAPSSSHQNFFRFVSIVLPFDGVL